MNMIAIYFSVDEDTVYRWVKRWNEEMSVADREQFQDRRHSVKMRKGK